MVQHRIASLLIVGGASFGLASPSQAGGTHMMSKPYSPPMSCCGGGSHMGGSGGHASWGGGSHGSWGGSPMVGSGGHMSWGGSGGHAYSGGSSGHVVWGSGKPPLGTHPMGMHFYGMGGGMKYGGWSGHPHVIVQRELIRYSVLLISRSYGYGSSHESHMPLGSHMMGMHFYGMGGGSLGAKYGHLEHDYDSHGGGSGSYGASGSHGWSHVSHGGNYGSWHMAHGPSWGEHGPSWSSHSPSWGSHGPSYPKSWGSPMAYNSNGGSWSRSGY